MVSDYGSPFLDGVRIKGVLQTILVGGARSCKIVGGARKRGIGSDVAHHQPEALWIEGAMAPKEAKSEAIRKLAPPTSLQS